MNRPDLIESAARAMASALGLGIVEVACLATLVFAFVRLSRPSATTRHVLWWIALAAGTTLPLVSIATSLGRIEHRSPAPVRTAWVAPAKAAKAASHSSARVWTASEMSAADRAQPAGTASTFEGPAALAGRFVDSLAAVPYLAAGLIALWFVVALAGLGQLTRSLLALAVIKRAALPLDETVVRRLRRWRHSTRLGRSVELRVSSDVDVPVAVGFRTPTILLPLRVVETEAIADLDQIAMHEYAHLDRYDDWTNLVQRVVERIFWFNPIVLLVGRQISLEREIACDDWVVAQTGRAHRYATCLWKLVESARLPAKPILAPGALLSPKQITTRIEQLLDSRRNALPRLSPLGAIALGSLGVALIVLQAQRAPVIAVEDGPAAVATAGPATATVQAATAAPAALGAPRAALSPKALIAPRPVAPPNPPGVDQTPAPIPPHVVARATADAVAHQLAAALAQRDHTLVRATIEKTIHQHIASSVASAAQAAAVEAEAEAQAGADAAADAGAEAGAAGARFGSAISRQIAAELDRTVAENWASDREPGTLTRDVVAKCFGCDLRGRDLRGLDLHDIALNGVDLRGADLRGVNLSGSRFFGVDLRNAKLDGANLHDTTLNGCDLRGTSLANAKLDGLHLVGTSIRGVTLGGSNLRSLIDKCMGCDLRGIDLRGQDLSGIELEGADLRGADLRGANLSGARLTGVNLSEARFEGADLTNASLTGCELRGTDLGGAKTRGLSTVYTDVRGLKQRLARLDISLRALSKLDFLPRPTCSLHKLMAP